MNPKWKYFNTVTMFSKIIAAVLFVGLPFVGFYIGFNYGVAVGRTEQQLNTPLLTRTTPLTSDNTSAWVITTPVPTVTIPAALNKTACTFYSNNSGGYGLDKVTSADTTRLCTYFKENSPGNENWDQVFLTGKEGNYILAGNVLPCLLDLSGSKVKSLFCKDEIANCSEVDGLKITHLFPSCMETATNTARATK